MRLIDKLRSSSDEQRLTFDDYVKLVNQFTFNGTLFQGPFQETMNGNVERVEDNFEGLVRSAYKANGIVFAVMLARRAVFTEARFQFRRLRNGRPGDFFGTPALGPLEKPFPGGVTGDLLARMIDDADLAGNWYGFRDLNEIVRLRPDWVDIILTPRIVTGRGGNQLGWQKLGYAYFEDGQRDGTPVGLGLDEVAHFAPIPDPLAWFRGMSWLTPVIRELTADSSATVHKRRFFENAATPNMIVRYPEIPLERFKQLKETIDAGSTGPENAYKTLHLAGGADVTIVGSSFREMDFKATQGAGETRIAAAAGVPPVVVGFSEGLSGSSLNQGNYMAARRNFADRTIRPLWRNAAASLEMIVPAPASAELAVDDRDISFLREDAMDEVSILKERMLALESSIRSGFTADSAVDAVESGDLRRLEHTGLFSVQLQPPMPQGQPADPDRAVTITDPQLAARLIDEGWRPVRS